MYYENDWNEWALKKSFNPQHCFDLTTVIISLSLTSITVTNSKVIEENNKGL